MNLWIRSQDGEVLKKVETLELNYNHNESINENNFTFDIIDGDYILGKYKTKERALEVLDKIEKFIIPEDTIDAVNYNVADLKIKAKLVESNMDRIFVMPNQ